MNPRKLYPALFNAFLLTAVSASMATADSSARASAPAQNVITIMAKQKTFTSEGSVTIPTIRERAKLQNFSGEIHTVAENQDSKPQVATVRFQELDAPLYDLYVNGTLLKTAKLEDIQAGTPIQLSAGYGAEYLPFFRRIQAAVRAVTGSIKNGANDDTATVGGILSVVDRSCSAAEIDFRQSRSCYMILVPADRPMSRSPMYSTINNEEASRRLGLRFQDLAVQRSSISARVQDRDLRDKSIAALTPLEFTAVVSKPNAKGIRQLQCTITNLCESPVDAQISLERLPGWAKTQPLALKDVKPGKSGKVTFQVKAPAGAIASGLKIKAALRIGKVTFQSYAAVSSS